MSLDINIGVYDGGDGVDPADFEELAKNFIFKRGNKTYQIQFEVRDGKPGVNYKEVK